MQCVHTTCIRLTFFDSAEKRCVGVMIVGLMLGVTGTKHQNAQAQKEQCLLDLSFELN